MFFTRILGVALVFGVLVSGTNAFVFAQSSGDSLSRLNSELASQNITLDEASKNKVQNSCLTTQNNLKSLRQKEQRIQRDRIDTYLDIQNEIDALQLRLKRQGVEVGGAATALMGYLELTDQYDRLSKLYYGVLNDTITVDCRTNPQAFVAGLAVVRQKRTELLNNTNAIRDFIFTNVQDQFKIIKTELKV